MMGGVGACDSPLSQLLTFELEEAGRQAHAQQHAQQRQYAQNCTMAASQQQQQVHHQTNQTLMVQQHHHHHQQQLLQPQQSVDPIVWVLNGGNQAALLTGGGLRGDGGPTCIGGGTPATCLDPDHVPVALLGGFPDY
jgi:hypothetical protein